MRARWRLWPGFGLALVLAFAVVGAPRLASATVVVLVSGDLGPYSSAVAGFRASYHDPLVEIPLDPREPQATRRLIDASFPEVIVAVGAPAAGFARDGFPRIPLVYVVVHDPRRYDLTGQQVTGVLTDVPPRAQLDALRKLAPDVRRVAMVRGAESSAQSLRAAKAAAAAAGAELVEVLLPSPAEAGAVLRDAVGRVDALWLPADRAVASPEVFQFLLQLSLEQRRPLLVFSEALVHAGALIGVTPDYGWAGGQAAELVRRIESGDRAGDLPPVPLGRTRVIVNPATARALGRDVPASMTESGDAR